MKPQMAPLYNKRVRSSQEPVFHLMSMCRSTCLLPVFVRTTRGHRFTDECDFHDVFPLLSSVPPVLANLKDDQSAPLSSLGPGGCDLHLWEIHPKVWKEDPPDSVQRSV